MSNNYMAVNCFQDEKLEHITYEIRNNKIRVCFKNFDHNDFRFRYLLNVDEKDILKYTIKYGAKLVNNQTYFLDFEQAIKFANIWLMPYLINFKFAPRELKVV